MADLCPGIMRLLGLCCGGQGTSAKADMLREPPRLAWPDEKNDDIINISPMGIAMFGVIVCRKTEYDTSDTSSLEYWDNRSQSWVYIQAADLRDRMARATFDTNMVRSSNTTTGGQQYWSRDVRSMILTSSQLERGTYTWQNFKEGVTRRDIVLLFPALMNESAVSAMVSYLVEQGRCSEMKTVTQYIHGSVNSSIGHRLTLLTTMSKSKPTRQGVRVHAISQLWDRDYTSALVHSQAPDRLPSRLTVFGIDRRDADARVIVADITDRDLISKAIMLGTAQEVFAFVAQQESAKEFDETPIMGILCQQRLDSNILQTHLVSTVGAALRKDSRTQLETRSREDLEKGRRINVALTDNLMEQNGSVAKYARSVHIGQFRCMGRRDF